MLIHPARWQDQFDAVWKNNGAHSIESVKNI